MNPTLRNLFIPDKSHLPRGDMAHFLAPDGADLLKERLAGVASWIDAYRGSLEDGDKKPGKNSTLPSQVNIPDIFSLVAEKMGCLLNIDIVTGIFIKVWNETELFRKYLDPKTYNPNETIQINLVDHTVSSSHAPSIGIRFDGSLIKELHFEITAELKIEGAILEIRDGKIRRLKVGCCQGKGELSCEGLLLAKKELEPIEIPSEIDFGDEIRIFPDPNSG